MFKTLAGQKPVKPTMCSLGEAAEEGGVGERLHCISANAARVPPSPAGLPPVPQTGDFPLWHLATMTRHTLDFGRFQCLFKSC